MLTELRITDVATLREMAKTNDSDYHAAVWHAADDYIRTRDAIELRDQVYAAAVTAIYAGDGGAVWMLKGLINGPQSYGEYLKRSTSLMLHSFPAFIEYFSTEFSRGVVERSTALAEAA